MELILFAFTTIKFTMFICASITKVPYEVIAFV
jgi:hypothetical protein